MPRKIIDIIPPKEQGKHLPEPPSAFFEKFKKPPQKPFKRPRKISFKKGLILSFIILVLLGVFAYFTVMGIQIDIWPVSETLEFEEDIVVEAAVNGKFIEEEKMLSQQFPSSGITLKEVKAEGTILVYNKYHLPQILVATTRFLSANDKLFRSQKRAYIPSGGSLDVQVKADSAGEEYNIGPSTFSIPGLAGSPRYTAVYGKSSSAMTGGFKDKVKQVTEQDLETAKTTLIEKVKEDLKKALELKAGNRFILSDEAITQEVLEASSLALKGTEIDQFNFKVKMKAKALVFKKQWLKDFAREFIQTEMGEGKQLNEGSLKIDYEIKSVESGKFVLKLKFSGKIYADINTASLKRALQGKPLKEARLFLKRNSQIFKAEIRLWPFWKTKIPSSLEKIKIDLKIETW